MNYITRKILTDYPDTHLVIGVFNEVKKKEPDMDETDDDDFVVVEDNKWRPMPLIIAVLYKIQDRNDDFFRTGKDIDFESNRDCFELLGYFWHQQHHMGKMLREGISKVSSKDLATHVEKNKVNMIQNLKLDIVHVSLSELCVQDAGTAVAETSKSLLSHTPDFVIHVDHEHTCVVLTVLGTRIFPRPNPQDIIMDLAARCHPFLDGQAHGGIVVGHNNMVKFVMPRVREQMEKYPHYTLLVVGYSLGAALAQLFLLDLKHGNLRSSLPASVKIRGILYGVPPVYQGNLDPVEDIVMVSNHNDGVTGASLHNLQEVVTKVRAIRNIGLRRRTLLKMALNINSDDIDEEGVKNILNDVPDNDTKSSLSGTLKKFVSGATKDNWNEVQTTVDKIQKSLQPNLTFVGPSLIVLKKSKTKDGPLRVSQFSGRDDLKNFTSGLRFKYGMFDHHMPWSYNTLFAGRNINIT